MANSPVFIIAECGSNWRFQHNFEHEHSDICSCQLHNAYRMIRAAKECGADAAKFQWVSDYKALMTRRGETFTDETERIYSYVHFPASWLPLLKAECDRVGIEFMCTAYLPQDVAEIAKYVKRFKVAAKECTDEQLLEVIASDGRPTVISTAGDTGVAHRWRDNWKLLYCVSEYPTPLERLHLGRLDISEGYDGFSDHTAYVMTGALAVARLRHASPVIESHVRLHDTPESCPDYGHSLTMGDVDNLPELSPYAEYVRNIRTAERMI